MPPQRDLPEPMAWRAIGRMEAGQTQQEVAQAIGVSQSVIYRLWNRFQRIDTVHRRSGQGRPRATTARDDRYHLLTACRNRWQNATQLQSALLTATGRRVSTQTVCNRLHGSGLYARRPMVCTRLTPQHHRDCRNWAEEHREWWDTKGIPNGDHFFFLASCDSTWNLIVAMYSSGGNKEHEKTQLLYWKDLHMAVVG